MSNEKATCATCGTELPSSGQCPKCLIGLGLDAGTDASLGLPPGDSAGLRNFAGYTLVRQIGRGGMGVVYEAVEVELNRPVALKLILDTHECSPVARRRFLIEAEAAARLDHPNVVPIYHVGEHEDRPFITMKLVKGESLRVKMDRGEIGLSKGGDGVSKPALAAEQRAIARLMATVARAMHHAHKLNVIHRDLKPANILLDPEGQPQLTDFGLAKILDDQHAPLTEPGLIQGTIPYLSPEQIRAQPVSEAADTYSLGVILYELLAGQRPFKGTTSHETMRLIEEQPAPRLRQGNKHLHPDLETICLKCLEKDPCNRYSTIQELAEDLERWLHNEPIKARPAGPILRLSRWARRNPLGMALILSLSVALGALTGFFLQLKRQSDLEYLNKLTYVVDSLRLLWEAPNRTNQVVKAETLADLQRKSLPDTEDAQRVTLAFEIGENPAADVLAFAPLLWELQRRMSHTLRSNVVLDLMICKSFARFNELTGETAHFQRLGGVLFWRAKEVSPGVQAVVQDREGKDAVIVVRKDSPIFLLSQFKKRSFAFPDPNATLGVWAKVKLAKAGVTGNELSSYETIDDLVPVRDLGVLAHQKSDVLAPSDVRPPGSASGVAAAEMVREGRFDGAVLQKRYFERIKHKGPGLRAVDEFESTPNIFAARAGLDPGIIAAFQRALLSLNDEPELLSRLPLQWAKDGFQLPDFKALDQLRRGMTNEARLFELSELAPEASALR